MALAAPIRQKITADQLRSLAGGLLISVFTVVLCVGLPEAILRIYGFEYRSRIEFDLPRHKEFRHLRQSSRYLWTLDPRDKGVNSLGFPATELTAKKRNDFRILFLGDSCVQQGYPEITKSLLAPLFEKQGKNLQVFNFAVSGYSSAQGLRVAQDYMSVVQPDYVVVQFGWNDHWLADKAPDSVLLESHSDSAFDTFLSWMLANSRMLQLGLYASRAISPRNSDLSRDTSLRVSAQEFSDNMSKIVAAAPAEVLLVTAPSAHYQLGVPGILLDLGFGTSKQSIVSLHKEYAERVRSIAQETQTALLDLDKIINEFSWHRMRKIFSSDGIHYKPIGNQVIARQVAKAIARQTNLEGKVGRRKSSS